MDIYDIIIPAPEKTVMFELNMFTLYIAVFVIILFIVFIAFYKYKKLIAIVSLRLLQLRLKNNTVGYKTFAFSLANILSYYHDISHLDINVAPQNSPKDKLYLWISLIDSLDSIRYKKIMETEIRDSNKVYDLAVEWIKST